MVSRLTRLLKESRGTSLAARRPPAAHECFASCAVLLIILDGFGLGKPYRGNAYFLAKKPNLEEYFQKYPWVKMKASGNAVGVPEGTQGGSEIGHFTIGAGRIVWQSLETINRSIRNGSFFQKKVFVEACRKLRRIGKSAKKPALHLIGMISDQGVHSHLDHLFALLKLAKERKTFPIFIHAILDGRDVPEKSAQKFIRRILSKIHRLKLDQPLFPGGPEKASIASIIGRYYAMDRDMNWKRTEKAYDLYTLGKGKRAGNAKNPLQALNDAYRSGIKSDYYIPPIILDSHGTVESHDSVIFWNFRTDRARQLTWAFTGESTKKNPPFHPEKMVRPFFVCMGPYSKKAPVVFPTPTVKNNLGSILSHHRIPQLRIAETEKYAHVTYFFNSQIEKPLPLEKRILIHSLKTPSYASRPEMSSHGITKKLIREIAKRKYPFVAVNFANCDLVGHSGVLKAAVKAVEVVDTCLGKIVPTALKNGYDVMITGDHGNVEYMIYNGDNPTGKSPGKPGEPCPSHTTNPVPFIFIPCSTARLQKLIRYGLHRRSSKFHFELKDIAPTILKLLNLPKPKGMTGKSLIL